MTNSYPSGSPGVPDSSMPTGAPGFVPRRSSYASVVSGTASGALYQQPARSGAFSHLLNQSDFSYDPSHQSLSGHQRFDPRTYDADFNANGSSHRRSGSWGRGGQLHPFSSAFAALVNGNGYGGFGGSTTDQFFIPSYLKGSRYVQRLEEAHKAKVAAQKDGQSAPSSQPGSLSTSASSINLHAKMGSSYRGIAHDIIEKAPPAEDETLTPLPSKWNILDKYGGLEVLNDGLEVKLSGPKSERDRDHEACSLRADHPMPSQCGIYYFEVDIVSRKREESSIGIGFSTKNVPLSRLPGWEPESYAYHGDDGHSFCCQSSGKHYGPPFNAGDVIGCGVNFRTGCAFFTKNGDHLGTAFRDIKENKGKLFPSVGMKKTGEHIRVNFGQRPFVFDIDGMMSASNTFPYPHSPSSSDIQGNGFENQENGTESAGDPGPSLGEQNTASPSSPATEAYISNLPQVYPQLYVNIPAPTNQPAPADHESNSPATLANDSPEQFFNDIAPLRQSSDATNHLESNGVYAREETLGPFDTLERALMEGRRRQQEASSGALDTATRPYITFSTFRTSQGLHATTLFTWYHPLEASVNRRNSAASSVTVTLANAHSQANDNGAPMSHTHTRLTRRLPPPWLRGANRDPLTSPTLTHSSPFPLFSGLLSHPRPQSAMPDLDADSRRLDFRDPSPHPSGSTRSDNRAFPTWPSNAIQEHLLDPRNQQTRRLARHQASPPGARNRTIIRSPRLPRTMVTLGRFPEQNRRFRPHIPTPAPTIRPPDTSSLDLEQIIREWGSRNSADSATIAGATRNAVGRLPGSAQAVQQPPNVQSPNTAGLLIEQAPHEQGVPETRILGDLSDVPSGEGHSPDQNGDAGQDSSANSTTIRLVRIPHSSESTSAQIALIQAQIGRLRQDWISTSSLMWIGIRANGSLQREKRQIRQEIEATSTAKLSPPLDETELIQALILQALAHDGYVETARAFAEEVHAEKQALSLDPNEVVKGFDVEEDEDAGHRQRIRTAVLEGDIEKALKYTNVYYPNVLKDNEHVYFRLRCRKFIEMVRQAAELQNSSSKASFKKSNGHNGDYYDDAINHDMELDDHQNSNNYDRMDTEEIPENQSEYLQLLQDTLEYGRVLQAEFQNDPRREVKKGLDDIFALMAYQDPLNAKEVSHFLDTSGRMAVAEELNSAILLSLGKSSSAALEKLYQQTYVLLEDLREGGGPGSLVNIDDYVRPKSGSQ
ncbi:SPRY-domain-containing protein [Acephala macrosclerotiorum]|nr:SPRY-domain-containing protein [Acephala macrosclerotiorum]